MAKLVVETAEDYPRVVVDFGDGFRVIECGAGVQWIVQKRIPRMGYPWQGQYFCRTKEALLDYSGHGDHPALLGLPDRFPEGAHACGGANENEFDSPPLPHQPPEAKTDHGGHVAHIAGPLADDRGSFDRLWGGDGVLSGWRPSGSGEVPDIPDFLRRAPLPHTPPGD